MTGTRLVLTDHHRGGVLPTDGSIEVERCDGRVRWSADGYLEQLWLVLVTGQRGDQSLREEWRRVPVVPPP